MGPGSPLLFLKMHNENKKNMTKTAIALFGSRISPRFDCTQEFMLVTSSENTVIEQHIENIRTHVPLMKVRRLADLKVDLLICGGVDESSLEHLRLHGITVIANMKGQVEDVVSLPPRLTALRPGSTISPAK